MDNKLTEQIEKFLANDLQGTELTEFKKKLAQNPKLQRMLDLHREVEMAIKENDVMKLRSKLEAIKLFPKPSMLERYLKNELQGNELAEFENKFAQELYLVPGENARRNTKMAATEDDIIKLRKKLKAIEFSQKPYMKRAVHSQKRLTAAAAVVIFLTLGLQSFSGGNTNIREIHKNYFNSHKLNQIRSERSDAPGLFADAFENYRKKDYHTALIHFGKALKSDSLNTSGNFYAGMCCIETKDFEAAKSYFTLVVGHGNNLYIEKSEWYLGICYSALGNRTKAIEQFRKISKNSGFFKPNADQILKTLE